jgi:hypothetical protein
MKSLVVSIQLLIGIQDFTLLSSSDMANKRQFHTFCHVL